MVRKRWTIGLVGTYFGDAVRVAECEAVSHAVARRGANLIVVATTSAGPTDPLLNDVIPANVDGILISRGPYPSGCWDSIAKILQRLPGLTLWHQSGAIPSAVRDVDGAFASAVEHLAERHGRRRIAVLGQQESLARFKRNPAVERFSLDPTLFIEGKGNYLDGSWPFLLRVLSRVDALVVESTLATRDTTCSLQQGGYLIPDDVAIIACDRYPGAEYYTPALTTTGPRIETFATLAADYLLDCLERGEVVRDLVVPSSVIEGESCGCRFMNKALDQNRDEAQKSVTKGLEGLRDQVLQYALAAYDRAPPDEVQTVVDRLFPVFLDDMSRDGPVRLQDELDAVLRQHVDKPTMGYSIRRSLWAMQRLSLINLSGDASRTGRAGSVIKGTWKRLARRGAWSPDNLFSFPRNTLIKCAHVEHLSSAFVEADRLLCNLHRAMGQGTSLGIERLAIVLVNTCKDNQSKYRLLSLLDVDRSEPILPAQAIHVRVQPVLTEWFPLTEPFTVFMMAFFKELNDDTVGFVVLKGEGGAAVAEAFRRSLSHGILSTMVYDRSQRQQSELVRANRDLEAFAYTVSHDLKAPLRGIASVAGWLSDDCSEKLNAEEREMLQLLLARVYRMHRLIDGVLRYSRAGRVRGATEDVDLDRLTRDIVDSLCFSDSVQVEVTSLPVVKCDQTSMVEVISNLLSNAVKHNDRPKKCVHISCEKGTDGWVLAVADNGPGIAPRHFDKIFQMFETLSAKDENTGVGLSIVRKLVEDWGGRIWVESTEGQGATFRFTLPEPTRPAGASDNAKNET